LLAASAAAARIATETPIHRRSPLPIMPHIPFEVSKLPRSPQSAGFRHRPSRLSRPVESRDRSKPMRAAGRAPPAAGDAFRPPAWTYYREMSRPNSSQLELKPYWRKHLAHSTGRGGKGHQRAGGCDCLLRQEMACCVGASRLTLEGGNGTSPTLFFDDGLRASKIICGKMQPLTLPHQAASVIYSFRVISAVGSRER
jgi:hypothetical protein